MVLFTSLLVHEARHTSGIRRNQLKYLILALVLGYLGGATNFPLWYNVALPPVGNILVSVYVLLFIYAVAKFRLLDIDILFKRGLVHALTLLALVTLVIKVGVERAGRRNTDAAAAPAGRDA